MYTVSPRRAKHMGTMCGRACSSTVARWPTRWRSMNVLVSSPMIIARSVAPLGLIEGSSARSGSLLLRRSMFARRLDRPAVRIAGIEDRDDRDDPGRDDDDEKQALHHAVSVSCAVP